MDKNLVLIGGAIVFDGKEGKPRFFIIRQPEGDGWEIPKVLVRKGESSVRAVLRLMGEKGGMSTRVLEEATRTGGVTKISGKSSPQRCIYYLMLLRSSSKEVIGFEDYLWADYSVAIKKLSLKKERTSIKRAKKIVRLYQKERQRRMKLNYPDLEY